MSNKSVTETVQKELPDFAAEVASLTTEEVNARLATLAKDMENVREAKEADEKLKEARETAKQFAAPYREAVKALNLKSRYLVQMLKDRGVE